MVMAMQTAQQLLEEIGVDRVKDRLQVGGDAVRKACAAGVLPCAWYAVLVDLAGRPLPTSLFSFKGQPEGEPKPPASDDT